MNVGENTQNTLQFKSGSQPSLFQGEALKSSVSMEKGENTSKNATADVKPVSFKGELGKILNEISAPSKSGDGYDIEDILKDMDLAETINLDTQQIDKTDAMFFVNMLHNNGLTDYTVSGNGKVMDSYKSVDVSKTILDMLTKAQDTKRPVRLDFDNNITVVLKLNADGKLSAQFFPGDKAAEEYLKQNIPYLKQRFDEQNISYANLSYKQQKNQQQQNQQEQSKEKNDE